MEHNSTMGLETLSIESDDLNENWKLSDQLSDFYKNSAWWALQRYQPKAKPTGGSLQFQVAESRHIKQNVLFLILWLVLLMFPLQRGFILGAAVYVAIYMTYVYVITGKTRTARVFGQMMHICLIYIEAFVHDRIPKSDIENPYYPELMSMAPFCLGFIFMYFGPKGFILSSIIMIAPGQLDIPEIFNINTLTLCTSVNYQHINNILKYGFPLPLFLLIILHSLYTHAVEKNKAVIRSVILVLAMIFLTHCTQKWAYIPDLCITMAQAASACIGMSMGREAVMYKRLSFWPKYIISNCAGILYLYLLGWSFQFHWVCLLGIPVLVYDVYIAWWSPPVSAMGTLFPIKETLKTLQLMEAGHIQPPIAFTLMDFGGNEEYTEMHHTFLSEKAIYCVVFNLQKALWDHEKQFLRICHWLGKIRMHVSDKTKPIAFLVGTHRDSILDSEPSNTLLQQFASFITQNIQRSALYEDWFRFNSDNTILFPVENTQSLDKDVGAIALQREISKAARGWLAGIGEHSLMMHKMIDICKNICKEGSRYMSKELLLASLRKRGMVNLTSETMTDYLIMSDQMGHLIYKSKAPLNEYVILDSELLVYIMKKFLEPKPSWSNRLPQQLERLEKHGIITMKLLRVILKDSYSDLVICTKRVSGLKMLWKRIIHFFWKADTVNVLENGITNSELDFIIYYLQELGSLCEIQQAKEGSDKYKEYLIPSRLPKAKCHFSSIERKSTFEFIIDCGENALVDLFPKILAEFLRQNSHLSGTHSSLYKDMAVINFPATGMCIVQCNMANFHQQLLEVNIYSKLTETKFMLERIMKACHEVLVQNMVSYQAGILCPVKSCPELQGTKKHVLTLIDKGRNLMADQDNVVIYCDGHAVKINTDSFSIEVCLQMING